VGGNIVVVGSDVGGIIVAVGGNNVAVGSGVDVITVVTVAVLVAVGTTGTAVAVCVVDEEAQALIVTRISKSIVNCEIPI
jgi:hypothetical protein